LPCRLLLLLFQNTSLQLPNTFFRKGGEAWGATVSRMQSRPIMGGVCMGNSVKNATLIRVLRGLVVVGLIVTVVGVGVYFYFSDVETSLVTKSRQERWILLSKRQPK